MQFLYGCPVTFLPSQNFTLSVCFPRLPAGFPGFILGAPTFEFQRGFPQFPNRPELFRGLIDAFFLIFVWLHSVLGSFATS